jgi:transcriptional regulator with AAA-type ATPase domain
MEYYESLNTKRTESYLEKIKAYKRGGARTILLFGKPGVGKSSLAEHITGASGLSGDSETGIGCLRN